MKLRIFALAFAGAFVFCFSAAAFLVAGFEKPPEDSFEEEAETVFLEEDFAVFLLIHKNKNGFGPFTLVCFDAESGRIPVFSFSEKAAFDYGGVTLSAGSLFSSVSPGIFCGAVEKNLGIMLSGYFIWDERACEEIIGSAGTFDYILPKSLYFSDGKSYVNLISGVQNMNGKKICDVVDFPRFSEAERCDTASRLCAAFLNRRLKRLLPESRVHSVIFNYTETDLSAFDRERYSKLIEVLCASGESLSGHITNDTEKDPASGLLYFSKTTKERVKKYFLPRS